MKTRNVTTTVLRRMGALGTATALAITLAACGDDDDNATETTGTSVASDIGTEGLTFADSYVGAKDADTGMTAVFGVLTNTTDEDIHLTEVTGDLAGEYQYHEVVDGVMRETADGITVPAGESLTLEPGGHHIMIMMWCPPGSRVSDSPAGTVIPSAVSRMTPSTTSWYWYSPARSPVTSVRWMSSSVVLVSTPKTAVIPVSASLAPT